MSLNLIAHEVAHVTSASLITLRGEWGESLGDCIETTLQSIDSLTGALASDAVFRTGRIPVFDDLFKSHNAHDAKNLRYFLQDRDHSTREKSLAVQRGLMRGTKVAATFQVGGPVIDKYIGAAAAGSFIVHSESWERGPGAMMSREAWSTLYNLPHLPWELLYPAVN